MTHHNRRAYTPKPAPDTPLTRQLVADMIAAGEKIRNQHYPLIYLTRREYDWYIANIQGKPDPDIRIIGEASE